MKQKTAVLLLLICLLSGCGAVRESENGYRQISTQEAADLMKEETDHIILDVRTFEEYETAHIPGAICIPNETIGTEEIPELPDKDQLILVYCRSGNRSKQRGGSRADHGAGGKLHPSGRPHPGGV